MERTSQAFVNIMNTFSRYGIYFVPRSGRLFEFGSNWLGWDCVVGTARLQPLSDFPNIDVRALAKNARRYGFHATLKPPFRLSQSSSREYLEADISKLARKLAPVNLGQFEVAVHEGVVELVPREKSERFQKISTSIVPPLDPHRAKLSSEETNKRQKQQLTPAQQSCLNRWGYPYTMEEFRFHFSMSDKLPPSLAKTVARALGEFTSEMLRKKLILEDICLVGEDPTGYFHVLRRYPLKGFSA